MAFTLYHASQMPLLRIQEVRTEKVDDTLHRVWVTVDNSRLIPTHTEQDVANHINGPDIISLTGPGVKVLSSGRVVDRFFKNVEPVERRPDRLEIPTIRGMGEVRVQFLVSGGAGASFTVTVDSPKAGLFQSTQSLGQAAPR